MKLLPVNYHTQRNNTKFKIKPYFPIRKYPSTSCFTTSLNMILSYCGIKKRDEDLLNDLESKWFKRIFKRTYGSINWMMNFFYRNTLRYLWKAEMLLGNHYLKKVSKRLKFLGFNTWNTFKQRVISEIDNNRPVIVGLKRKIDGKKFGHIIVIIGYNEESFIIHDPYGNGMTLYKETYGYCVIYPYSYLKTALHLDRMLVLEEVK